LRLDAAPAPAPSDHRPMTMDAIEQEAIRAALARHGGNVVVAADELGMSRSALYRRMEKFGL
jgi:transcriptional regulator of acetoin/glycerol metabolism